MPCAHFQQPPAREKALLRHLVPILRYRGDSAERLLFLFLMPGSEAPDAAVPAHQAAFV